MPEINWSEPVADRTLTTNETALLMQQTQIIAAGTTAAAIPSASRFVYFAAFDGTNNNRDNLARAGDAQGLKGPDPFNSFNSGRQMGNIPRACE